MTLADAHEFQAAPNRRMKARPRRPDETITFDSTDAALQDVAAAAIVYESALRSGTGTRLNLGA